MNRLTHVSSLMLLIVFAISAMTGCQSSTASDTDSSASTGAFADAPMTEVKHENDDDDDGDDDEETIPLDEVPGHVKQAALAAVPGLRLSSAERETENGTVVYDLSGTADGVEHEVEVSASGTVGEIEVGLDDD